MKNQNSINELEIVINSIVNAGLNNTIISKGFVETFQGLEQSKLINLDEIIQKILVNKIGDIKNFINNKNNTADAVDTVDTKDTIKTGDDKNKINNKINELFGTLFGFNCCDVCKYNEECNLPNKGELSYCEEFENYDNICENCEDYDSCTKLNKEPRAPKEDIKNPKEEVKNTKTSITGNPDTDSFFQDVLNGTSTEYFVLPVNELENFKKLQTAIKVLKLNLNISDLYKVQNGVFYFNTPKGKNSFDTKRVNFNN